MSEPIISFGSGAGEWPDIESIEFKTREDCQKMLKLYMHMSDAIKQLEERLMRIEGFLVL